MQIVEATFGNNSTIDQKFKPKYRFVDLFHHHTEFGEEFSLGTRPADGAVIRGHRRPGPKQLPTQRARLLGPGRA